MLDLQGSCLSGYLIAYPRKRPAVSMGGGKCVKASECVGPSWLAHGRCSHEPARFAKRHIFGGRAAVAVRSQAEPGNEARLQTGNCKRQIGNRKRQAGSPVISATQVCHRNTQAICNGQLTICNLQLPTAVAVRSQVEPGNEEKRSVGTRRLPRYLRTFGMWRRCCWCLMLPVFGPAET